MVDDIYIFFMLCILDLQTILKTNDIGVLAIPVSNLICVAKIHMAFLTGMVSFIYKFFMPANL